MTERTSGIQPFTVAGVTFRCFIAEDGSRYVWRSVTKNDTTKAEPKGLAVGRIGAKCWARAAGQIVGSDFKDIKEAMRAAAGRKAG
jgi:hypothetical protein